MEENLSGKMVLKKWFEQKQCGCLGGTGTKVKGSHKQFISRKMIVLLPQKEEHRRRSIRWFHCSNACLTLVNLLCNRSGPKMKHQKEQFCWYCIVCVIYIICNQELEFPKHTHCSLPPVTTRQARPRKYLTSTIDRDFSTTWML